MSACQHFKQAFLQQCTAAGLSLAETHELVKSAAAGLTEKQALDPSAALGWGLAVPAAVGGAGGYGLAKLQELFSQDEDPAEIKNRETVEALRRAVRRVAAPQLEEALEAAGAEAGLEGA